MTFDQAVHYLSNRITFSPKKDPARLKYLLAHVGSPQETIPVVHVAGTNGKGSVTTMTAAILQAAGHSVGAYLSPYVFDIRERWMVSGLPISQADLARHVTELAPYVEAMNGGELGNITEFELKTAVAFKHFGGGWGGLCGAGGGYWRNLRLDQHYPTASGGGNHKYWF